VQLAPESRHVNTFFINGDGDDVCPGALKGLDGPKPGRHLADDGVAPVDQGVEEKIDGLRSPGGDEDVFAVGADALVARELGDDRVDET
jgi:hypothetical protein